MIRLSWEIVENTKILQPKIFYYAFKGKELDEIAIDKALDNMLERVESLIDSEFESIAHIVNYFKKMAKGFYINNLHINSIKRQKPLRLELLEIDVAYEDEEDHTNIFINHIENKYGYDAAYVLRKRLIDYPFVQIDENLGKKNYSRKILDEIKPEYEKFLQTYHQ